MRKTGAACVTIGTSGMVATTASAESGSSPPQGLLADGIGIEGGDRQAFLFGWLGSLTTRATSPAVTVADRMRNEFNANADHWLAYGNWLIEEFDDVQPLGTVTLGVDVVMTTWIGDDDRVETILEATYDDEEEAYTDLEWRVLDDEDDPDYSVRIEDKNAQNAADELQWYRREFIDTEDHEDHDLPDEEQASKLAGRYASLISPTDEDSRAVLELLLGKME